MPGIIKAKEGNADSVSESHVAFNFDDIGKQAEDYLQNVRTQADDLIEQAKQRAKAAEDDARQEAWTEALKKLDATVEERTQQRLAETIPVLEKSIEEIRKKLDHWREQWEQKALNLATGIAEKIIQSELHNRPEIVLNQVRGALSLTSPKQQLELKLNPLDLEIIGSSMDQLLTSLGRIGNTAIVPDENIERGGCLVLTEFGVIDNQIRSQLDRIEAELSAKR